MSRNAYDSGPAVMKSTASICAFSRPGVDDSQGCFTSWILASCSTRPRAQPIRLFGLICSGAVGRRLGWRWSRCCCCRCSRCCGSCGGCSCGSCCGCGCCGGCCSYRRSSWNSIWNASAWSSSCETRQWLEPVSDEMRRAFTLV